MIREQYPFFQLDTEHTSYCFRVTETGHLEHLHYGRKITSGENLTESLAIFAEKHAFAPGNTNVYDKEHPEFSWRIYGLRCLLTEREISENLCGNPAWRWQLYFRFSL